MFSQGSYNLQSGQGTQTSRPPPFLQHPPALPPSQNFQQGPVRPLPHVLPRPGHPGLPIYQPGPLAPHLAVRQVQPGLPGTGQPYFPPPPAVHGGPRLPHVYTTARPNSQGSQHSSYLASGLPPPPPPPPGSHHVEMLQAPLPPRSLPPTASHDQTLYRAPFHQLPQQPVGVQGLQQIPPPPPPLPTFSTSSLSGNILAAAVGNSQMSSMVPPSMPPPPPLPSSPSPIPPFSPPPALSAASLSLPLPAVSNLSNSSNPLSNKLFSHKSGFGPATEVRPLNQAEHSISVHNSMDDGSLSLEGKSGKCVRGDDLLSKRIVATNVTCPPKPAEGKTVWKIEELCQLIAKNGSAYEDMVRLKESGNPEFKFLFGGEPGSEAAVEHQYFSWMKKQCLLAGKSDGMQSAMSTNHLMVTTEVHSPADSDMEMEDDITRSDVDQAVNQAIESPAQDIGPISSEFDAKEQLHKLSSSAGSDAATMVLSERLGEGSKLVSNPLDLTFGRSVIKVESPVINSTGASEYPFASNRVESSTVLAEDNSSSKAAAAAECINSDSYTGQVIKGSIPFRVLQDYASNDSSENDEDPCLKDANLETVSPLVAEGTEKFRQDTELGFKGDIGSKSFYKTETLLSESSTSYKALESSSYSQRGVKETVPLSIETGLGPKHNDIKYENQSSINHAASHRAFPKEDALGEARANVPFSGKYEDGEDKIAKFTSDAQKIDKFGRLVREGASDSDSDDSHHAYRYNKRRRSRSRSPLDRKWRNRPHRRREKRSRSRSWSPRNQSRSRSPTFRHSGEFSSGNRRLEKGQLPECFDFVRGRCYRGASCRYLHHDSEKRDGSRNHKSKQQKVQLPPSSKTCKTHEADNSFSLKVSDHGQEIMNHEMRSNHPMSANSLCAREVKNIVHNGEDSVSAALVDSEISKSDSLREVVAKIRAVEERTEDGTTCVNKNFQEALQSDQQMAVDSFPSNPASDAYILKSHGEAPPSVISSLKDSVIQQSESVLADRILEDADNHAQQTDDSSVSDILPDKTSGTSSKRLQATKTLPNSADSVHNPSYISSFPPSAPNSEGNNARNMAQLSRDYNLMPQTAAFQSQSAPSENFPSYMLPNQNSLFSLPSNSSSAVLPPPPLPQPPVLPPRGPVENAGSAKPSVTLQYQESSLPPRGDIGSQMLRPYSTEFSGNSQVGEFQHRAYPLLQETHRSHTHLEGFRLKPLPGCTPSSQQLGSTMPFSQEESSNKMQSFSGDNLAPGETLKSSTHIHPYLQQQQASYSLHHSVGDGVYNFPGNFSSLSRCPPDLQERNQPSHFGVSSNSSHFNPYASTFEKPLSSRFGSDVFRKEKNTTFDSKHDNPLCLSLASVDAQGVGTKDEISPTSTSGIGRIIPRSGSDQYDPLFDSIEPSSNSYKKSGHIQNWEPSGSSDMILRLKGSKQLLDVEENNKKKEVDGIALAMSIDNEEFGETADLEVGDVENGSQSDPNALTNTNIGEVEIDQVKSPGKSKESRSMKLFKACLADFVKEVLKPSWRQGNMSKETFKTVVKKTVDKVSEAMKSHQIPKSKAKIDQYIDSSQRKLTKLVMGYVDKYAKG